MADVDMELAGGERKKKGRGFGDRLELDSKYGDGAKFEGLGGSGAGPAKSVEGWIVIVTGVYAVRGASMSPWTIYRILSGYLSLGARANMRLTPCFGPLPIEMAKGIVLALLLPASPFKSRRGPAHAPFAPN